MMKMIGKIISMAAMVVIMTGVVNATREYDPRNPALSLFKFCEWASTIGLDNDPIFGMLRYILPFTKIAIWFKHLVDLWSAQNMDKPAARFLHEWRQAPQAPEPLGAKAKADDVAVYKFQSDLHIKIFAYFNALHQEVVRFFPESVRRATIVFVVCILCMINTCINVVIYFFYFPVKRIIKASAYYFAKFYGKAISRIGGSEINVFNFNLPVNVIEVAYASSSSEVNNVETLRLQLLLDSGAGTSVVNKAWLHQKVLNVIDLMPPQDNRAIMLTDGQKYVPSAVGSLKLNEKIAVPTEVFDHSKLGMKPIVSLAGIIDGEPGRRAIYDEHKVVVIDFRGHVIVQGARGSDGLWYIDSIANERMNSRVQIFDVGTEDMEHVHRVDSLQRVTRNLTTQEQAAHLMRIMPCSTDTIGHALEENWIQFAWMTADKFKKNIPPITKERCKGGAKKTRQNYRSTKPEFAKIFPESPPEYGKWCNVPPIRGHSNNRAHIRIFSRQVIEGHLYFDATGDTQVESSDGMVRVVVFVSSAGYIHLECVPDHTGPELTKAFKRAYAFFTRNGDKPTWAFSDNESSNELESAMIDLEVTYLRVASNEHQKVAERAIQWFKSFFISVLASTDKNFPQRLWAKLIPAVELYMNLVTPSKRNPKVSTYMELMGVPNWEHMTLGQLGVACEAAVEVGPDRTGFKERSISGFYLGPAIGWYRTHLVWCTQTKAVIKTKSVEFLIDAQFPGVTPEAQLLAAAKDWAAAIERLGQRQDLTEAQRVSLGSLFKTNTETFNELRATFLPSTMTEGEKEADRQRVLEGEAEVASAQAQKRRGDAVDVEKLQDPPREEHQAPAGMEFVPLPGVDRDDQTKKADLFSGQQPADVEDHDAQSAGLSNSSRAPKQRTRASAALKGAGDQSKGASAKSASKGASAAQTSKIAAAASTGEDEDGFVEVVSKKQRNQRSKSSKENTAGVSERLLTMDELLANRRRALKQKRAPKASQEVAQVAPPSQEEQAKQTSATKEWLSLEELYARARSGRKEKKAKAATRDIEVPLANQESPRSALPPAPEILAAATTAPAEAPAVSAAAVRDKQEFLTLTQLYANRRRALVAKRVAREPTTAQITERSKQEDRERVKALTAAKKSAVGGNKRAAKQGQSVLQSLPIPVNSIEHIYFQGSSKARVKEFEAWCAKVDKEIAEINNIAAATGHDLNLDPVTGQPIRWKSEIKGPDKEEWFQAHHEETVRLVDETNTYKFIQAKGFKGKTSGIVNAIKKKLVLQENNEVSVQRRVRQTFDGSRGGDYGNGTAPVASMTQCKVLGNSGISDKNRQARVWTIDLKNFYLIGTKLSKPAYFKQHISKYPQQTIDKYNLVELADEEGNVIGEVTGGMYGHPEAGRLAHEGLKTHLAKHGFTSREQTPCIFANADHSIVFAVIVDDFLIKVQSEEVGNRLIAILEEKYELKIDKGPRLVFNGVQWDFDYESERRSVTLSVPGFTESMLKRFDCADIKGVQTPAVHADIKFSRESQMMEPDQELEQLSAKDTKRQQEIVGMALWYAKTVHLNSLIAISEAASTANTEDKVKKTKRILAYFKQWPDAQLTFHESDMILRTTCDASFASLPDGRSRAGICYHFGSEQDTTDDYNGMVEVTCKNMKLVMLSAAEAEYATTFYAAEGAITLAEAAESIGHPQTTLRICTDNSVAVGIANSTMNIKRSRTINTKFHWIRERVQAGQFQVCWIEGENNVADAFTKPLPKVRYLKFQKKLVSFPKLAK